MRKIFIGFIVLGSLFMLSSFGECQTSEEVEINGDEVQYSAQTNKAIVTGNVVVTKADLTLTCDRLEYDRTRSIGLADGHVVLVRHHSRFTGDHMIYNFQEMKGEFLDAKITAKPFYGGGQSVSKQGENHIVMQNGYITTCDLDHPHFKLRAKHVDIYQGDKAIARRMNFVLGDMPLLYLPKYTQSLKDKQPAYQITPGYKKRWGSFLLGQYRYYLNDDAKLTLHLDYRAARGLGEGADLNYGTEKYGKGLFGMYYTDEHFNNSKFFFQPNHSNSIQTERYEVSWQHKWTIDDQTNAIWQYYRASDASFLKDYYRKLYEQDSTPPTYFLMTRAISSGTLSFQATERVNRYVSALDRMPEVAYLLPNKELGATGFYLQNSTSYSNLVKADPSPSSNRQETMRIDTDNTITYPFKIKFVELSPFVGGRETFYTKTLAKTEDNSIRGLFRTGANLSTKFFKVYDANTNFLGLDLHRLRHVVTPSVGYFFNTRPTLASSKLVQYDALDALSQAHGITFGLENKLQTKRSGKSEDLVRLLTTSDFFLKEDTHKGGFNNVINKLDFTPTNWLGSYTETTYDTIKDHLSTVNFDVYFNDPLKKQWSADFGIRYSQKSDEQITNEIKYRINPKWALRTYQVVDVMNGVYKRQEYGIVRDLHEWEMHLDMRHDRTDGDEVMLSFTLKEFPGINIEAGSGFNRVKTIR